MPIAQPILSIVRRAGKKLRNATECTECSMGFSGTRSYKRHFNRHHCAQCDLCLEVSSQGLTRVIHANGAKAKACGICIKSSGLETVRIEHAMVNYLDGIEAISPYRLGSDNSCRSLGGCSGYRPDVIYTGLGFVLVVECDERGHSGSPAGKDEERIATMFAHDFAGSTVVVVRWNPDGTHGPKMSQRFEELGKVIEREINSNPADGSVKIVYMYFARDSKQISRVIPNVLEN